MSLITQNPYTNVVVVADLAWKSRAIGQDGAEYALFRWYPNVYDALVSVMLNGHCRGPTLICIRVDALTTEEMGIFRCLAGMPDVTAVAFSTISQPAKLAQARQLGAKDTITVEQLMNWIHPEPAEVETDLDEGKSAPAAEVSTDQDHSKESAGNKVDPSYQDIELTKMAEKVVADDLSRLAQQQIGEFSGSRPSQPEQKPSETPNAALPKASSEQKPTAKEPIQRPTLSPDELEALLG
jgi:hypothetical protein